MIRQDECFSARSQTSTPVPSFRWKKWIESHKSYLDSQLNLSKDQKPEQGQCYNECVATSFTATAAAIMMSTLTLRMATFQILSQRAILSNMFGQQHIIGQG